MVCIRDSFLVILTGEKLVNCTAVGDAFFRLVDLLRSKYDFHGCVSELIWKAPHRIYHFYDNRICMGEF